MTEGDRLCSLQMCISGEYYCLISLCLLCYRIYKLTKKIYDLSALVSQIKSDVKCDLIVSATCGVKLFCPRLLCEM